MFWLYSNALSLISWSAVKIECLLVNNVNVCACSGASSAAQLAAAAASQINAKLGVASAGPAPVVGTPDMSALFGIPFGPAQTEIITVPDRMVGLSK